MSSTFGSWDQLINNDAKGSEHVKSRREAILTTEHDTFDAALLCELRAFRARRVRGVEGTTVCPSMSQPSDFGKRVGFGME